MEALAEMQEASNPFEGDHLLYCISSGVVADETVNIDTAKQIGESIGKSMESKCIEYFTFKKKYQAVTLNCKIEVIIDTNSVAVDPQLLF